MNRVLLYKNMMKVAQRLPDHYKKRYDEYVNHTLPSPHIAYEEGNWKKIDGTDKIYPMSYFNIPPNVIHPPEMDRGLFSGEGIVVGYKKRTDTQPYENPRTWRPAVLEELFYSEVLDRWMIILVTMRTLKLIEQCGGFDEYILKSSDAQLHSRLGLHLKREILLKLANKQQQLYPNDEKKRKELLERFKDFIIPESEASWIGYTLPEAIFKQMKIEEESKDKSPLKIRFLKEYVTSKKSMENVN